MRIEEVYHVLPPPVRIEEVYHVLPTFVGIEGNGVQDHRVVQLHVVYVVQNRHVDHLNVAFGDVDDCIARAEPSTVRDVTKHDVL